MRVDFANGKQYCEDRWQDLFFIGYLQCGNFSRPSCYECQFKGFPQKSDITLADFWGIEKIDPSMDKDKGHVVGDGELRQRHEAVQCGKRAARMERVYHGGRKGRQFGYGLVTKTCGKEQGCIFQGFGRNVFRQRCREVLSAPYISK